MLSAAGWRTAVIRALMVDVDGVLVRGRPDDGRPWSAELEADLGVPAEDLQREFFAPHWDDIVLGRAALIDRLSPVLAAIAPQVAPERLVAYWFAQDARLDTRLLAELGAQRRRGVQIHLATNQDHMRAEHLMRTLGLSQHVDGIHYSAALGCRKPDAEFFHRAAGRVALPPGDLLLIDDSADNVRAARSAGWEAVHWTGESSLADLLVTPAGAR
jgi:putative hydrolase of the HAD superfamily